MFTLRFAPTCANPHVRASIVSANGSFASLTRSGAPVVSTHPEGAEMKRSLALASLIMLAAAAACSDQPTQPAAADPQVPAAASAAGRYIVVLREDDGMSPLFARAAVG